jgi:FkbM family methyltransferase
MRERGSIDGFIRNKKRINFLDLLGKHSRNYQSLSKKQPMPRVGYVADEISNYLMLGSYYEQEDLDAIFEFLESKFGFRPSGLAVDMGANIGNHSLYLSNLFDKVMSFEPHPDSFALLKINTRATKGITCLNFGVTDIEKTQTLYDLSGNMGASSLTPLQDSRSSVKIQLRTFDSFAQEIERVSLMKIDVEGHELEALIGSENCINRDSPIVLLERTAFEASYDKSNESLKWLQSRGYVFYWLESETESRGGIHRLIWLIKRWTIGHEVIWKDGWPPEKRISLVVAVRRSSPSS